MKNNFPAQSLNKLPSLLMLRLKYIGFFYGNGSVFFFFFFDRHHYIWELEQFAASMGECCDRSSFSIVKVVSLATMSYYSHFLPLLTWFIGFFPHVNSSYKGSLDWVRVGSRLSSREEGWSKTIKEMKMCKFKLGGKDSNLAIKLTTP